MDKPGHNHSSSPFTTLADIAERKVASTGAGQPNIDQRHDLDPMHIMLNSGCRTILIKSVQTFVAVRCYEAPGKHQTYQSVRVLPDRVIHRGAEKEEENRKGMKVKSWSPTSSAADCSHCNLISTSRRIDTGSAISNGLFNMPSPRESCVWVLKTGKWIVKETT